MQGFNDGITQGRLCTDPSSVRRSMAVSTSLVLGALTLTDTNTYTGPTTINQGS